MRLLLLVLLTTLGYADASDWHVLPGESMRAVPQARSVPEATAVPQVINGVFTDAYPAVARLTIWNADTVSLCTGTLVSPSTILTAAHCVEDGPVAIDADFFPTSTTVITYAVVDYRIHPEYHFPVADLAMLLLEAPVAGINPVPLGGQTPRPRTFATIIGYGQDEVGKMGIKEMGFVRLKRCPRRVPKLGLWPGDLARSLCWSASRSQQTTCHGDSGGPLLIGNTLAGLTSGADPNCTGFLSWDTSVVPFLSWITSLLL